MTQVSGGVPDENELERARPSTEDEGRRDVAYLDWVERITGRGWGPTLRASYLLVVLGLVVTATSWAVTGSLPVGCSMVLA